MKPIHNDIIINGKAVGLPKLMTKRLNFVEDNNFYTKGFTRIYVEDNQLFIGHTINNNKTKIELSELEDSIKYFDRI